MDLSLVSQLVIAALWYLLPLAMMVGLIKSPWFKGKFGEFLVNPSAGASWINPATTLSRT